MRKDSKKKHKKKFNIKLIIIFLVIIVAGSAIFWQLKLSRTQDDNNQQRSFTYVDCVMRYDAHGDPSRCQTPEGFTYMEFRIIGQTYEECVKAGGRIIGNAEGCTGKDKKYVVNYPEVKTYNECQEKYPRYLLVTISEPEVCIDKNGLVYTAGGENRAVNSFVECVKNGGPVRKQGKPKACYYEGVVYWQTVDKNIYLNPPFELKTFTDCVRPGMAIDSDGKELSCTAFNKKKYFYKGPPIRTYDDCVRVMRFVLTSNPPQCYGPDGTHFTGQRQ